MCSEIRVSNCSTGEKTVQLCRTEGKPETSFKYTQTNVQLIARRINTVLLFSPVTSNELVPAIMELMLLT